MNKEKIIEYLKNIIFANSTIATHAITIRDSSKSKSTDLINTANSILKNGLNISIVNGFNISSTCTTYGTKDLCDFNEVINYFYGPISISDDNKNVTVVVAMPDTFTDINGNEYFLGTFPKDLEKDDKKYMNYPLNSYCISKKMIPKEFIVGYIISNGMVSKYEDKEYKFVPNYDYIGWKTPDEQISYFESIKEDLIENNMMMVTPDAIEKATNIINLCKSFNLTYSYYRQLVEYAKQKYDIELKKH